MRMEFSDPCSRSRWPRTARDRHPGRGGGSRRPNGPMCLTAAQGKRPWRTVRWREGGKGWLGAKVVALAAGEWPPTAGGGSAG